MTWSSVSTHTCTPPWIVVQTDDPPLTLSLPNLITESPCTQRYTKLSSLDPSSVPAQYLGLLHASVCILLQTLLSTNSHKTWQRRHFFARASTRRGRLLASGSRTNVVPFTRNFTSRPPALPHFELRPPTQPKPNPPKPPEDDSTPFG